MVDIRQGQSFDIQAIQASQDLTFKGKPVTFEVVDEDERVYQARTELTDEDIKAGNLYVDVLTVQFPVGQGVVVVSQEAPKQLEKDFKNLSDAEKLTKLNSLQYTLNIKEPREIANGNLTTTIGQQAAKSVEKKQKGEDKSQLDKQNETGTTNVIEQEKSAKQEFENKAREEESKKNADYTSNANKINITNIQKDTDSKKGSSSTASTEENKK